MKQLLLIPLLLFLVTGCSHITMLRTEEIQEINDDVRSDLKKDLRQTNLRLDSLKNSYHLLEKKLVVQEQLLNRMKADLSILSSRMADESTRNDSRQEEIAYRLDLLLGKSDKILAKKVVVSGAPAAPVSLDSIERQANLLLEMETMFNTARADFLRGEYKIAFDGFKQVFEEMKTGEMAEESLYWMALCLTEAGQVDKAKVILNRLNTDFPEGAKTCITLFKLAGIAASENDVASQKQYLQTLLEKKQCMETNEFLQGAEMLEEILNSETAAPVAEEAEKPEETSSKEAPPAQEPPKEVPEQKAVAAPKVEEAPKITEEKSPENVSSEKPKQ